MLILKNNKIPLNKKSILSLKEDSLLIYEQKVIDFLKDWFNEEKEIKVKTSGTTGKPKEISFSKEQFVESAKRTIAFLGLRKGEKALLPLSTDYIAGKLMVLRAIVGELDLYVKEPSSNPLLLSDVESDFAAFVPMQLREILGNPVSFDRFERIRNVIIGGGVLNNKTEKRLSFLPQNIYHTYGMTETLTHIAMRQIAPVKEDFYRALPDVSFDLDNRDCLIVKVPFLYDEVLITNDIVELLDKSSFRYIGRYDNVINSGGVKLFPEEIENKLAELIFVPYYISSEPDERLGQRVILKIESGEPIEGLEELLSNKLKKYERPKKIYYEKKFRRTENGKLIRG